MRKQFCDIFEKCYQDIPGLEEAERRLSEQIEPLLIPFQEKLSPADYEKLGEMVYQAAYFAEREGFALGAGHLIQWLKKQEE